MHLRCTNCDCAFEGEKNTRCLKCLRRTSVIETIDDGPIQLSAAGPAPWPAGTTCSLCLANAVSDATFHLEIAKPGTGESGGHHQWTIVRCRCCDACRGRIAGLPRLRISALPIVALGTMAWLFALVSPLPMRVFGVGKLEAVMLSTLICAVIVGVPLVLVDRANNGVRRNLETSWLLRRLQARLGHEGGALSHELWRVTPASADAAAATDATELLRAEP